MTRTDYAYSGSEDKVTRRCLAKGCFQDEDKGFKGLVFKEIKIIVTRISLRGEL